MSFIYRAAFLFTHHFTFLHMHFFVARTGVYVCQRAFCTHNECVLVCCVLHTCKLRHVACHLYFKWATMPCNNCAVVTTPRRAGGSTGKHCSNISKRYQPASACERMCANVQQLIKEQALNETHALACAF